MTRYDYLKNVEAAFKDFRDLLIEEFPPELDDDTLEHANNELLIAVYEHTGDRRNP
jgi:hypothetical protein